MRLSATVLVVLALMVAGCGATTSKTVLVNVPTATRTSGSGDTETIVTTATGASTTTPVTVHLTSFRTPSKNIGCVMLDNTARCDIAERSWAPPPRPPSCSKEVDFGQGLLIAASGAGHFVCAGDTALDPTGTPLAYGTASVEGGLSCASAITGVTCSNLADGHGFFISRQGYKVF